MKWYTKHLYTPNGIPLLVIGKMDLYRKALEMEGELLQDIAYQEQVLENAGECYDGHSQDVDDCRKLLSAIKTFITSCEKKKD